MDRAAEQRTGAGTGGFAISLMGGTLSVFRPRGMTAPLSDCAPVTIRELLEREIARRELTIAPRTAETFRYYLKKICAQLGDVPACELTSGQVVAYVNSRKAESAMRREVPRLVLVRRELELLRRALRNAYSRGELARNPSLWWPLLRDVQYRGAFLCGTPQTRPQLSQADFLKLSNVLHGNKRAWLWFATLTGGDYGELLFLHREDIHLEAGTLHIRGTKSRTRDRFVPLHPRLAAHVRTLKLAPDAHILKPWRNRVRNLRQACLEAGLPYVINLKDLRRVYLSGATSGWGE